MEKFMTFVVGVALWYLLSFQIMPWLFHNTSRLLQVLLLPVWLLVIGSPLFAGTTVTGFTHRGIHYRIKK